MACHGLATKPDGERDTVRVRFSGIALPFCLRVRFVDILELI
jgi:hypothetical protein